MPATPLPRASIRHRSHDLPSGSLIPESATTPQPLLTSSTSQASAHCALRNRPPCRRADRAALRRQRRPAQSWADAHGAIAGGYWASATRWIRTATRTRHWRCRVRLAGGRSTSMTATRQALQLGWGLGCYRFDVTRNNTCTGATGRHLRPGNPPYVLAACVRVRDLVNTPTEQMGRRIWKRWRANLPPRMAHRSRWSPATRCWHTELPGDPRGRRASHRPPRIIELAWGKPRIRMSRSAAGCVLRHRRPGLKTAIGMRNHEEGHIGGAGACAGAGRTDHGPQAAAPADRAGARWWKTQWAADAFRPGEVVANPHRRERGDRQQPMPKGGWGCAMRLAAPAKASPTSARFATPHAVPHGRAGPDLPVLYPNDEALGQRLARCRHADARPVVADAAVAAVPALPHQRHRRPCQRSASRWPAASPPRCFWSAFVTEGQRWAHSMVFVERQRPRRQTRRWRGAKLRACYAMLRHALRPDPARAGTCPPHDASAQPPRAAGLAGEPPQQQPTSAIPAQRRAAHAGQAPGREHVILAELDEDAEQRQQQHRLCPALASSCPTNRARRRWWRWRRARNPAWRQRFDLLLRLAPCGDDLGPAVTCI